MNKEFQYYGSGAVVPPLLGMGQLTPNQSVCNLSFPVHYEISNPSPIISSGDKLTTPSTNQVIPQKKEDRVLQKILLDVFPVPPSIFFNMDIKYSKDMMAISKAEIKLEKLALSNEKNSTDSLAQFELDKPILYGYDAYNNCYQFMPKDLINWESNCLHYVKLKTFDGRLVNFDMAFIPNSFIMHLPLLQCLHPESVK